MASGRRDGGATRREFVRGVLGSLAGLALGGAVGCGESRELGAGGTRRPDKRSAGSLPADLAMARGGEPAWLVQKALGALGGMGRFVSRGDVVVIKPNLAFNRIPEQAANTNPLVIRELVILALQAGAKIVRILDHTLYEPRSCYARCGVADAVRDLGVELEYVDDRKFVDVDIHGEWIRNWPLYRPVLEADKLLNVPVAKQHSAARLSLGMKNLMGVIGGRRELFHQDMGRGLADLSSYLRPTLTVVDAYRILLRNGPQGGSLDDVALTRTVLAGVDPVAVDASGCGLFGVRPESVAYIREAVRRGLGTLSPAPGRLHMVHS